MADLGSSKEDWVPSKGEVQYVVIDEGQILNTFIASRDYRLSKNDVITISADGNVSVASQSLNKILAGGIIVSINGVAKIMFSSQSLGLPMSWTIGLGSPVIQNNMVVGASLVNSVPGAASGCDEIQKGVTITRQV